MTPSTELTAKSIAENVRAGRLSARAVTQAFLDSIQARDHTLNCFTGQLPERALATADAIDNSIARGLDPGPLAGVPFAVKNLFDVAATVTLAGSKINRDNAPASADAFVIQQLLAAGAVPIGTTNMDEYAYGFVTENAHYGATRNPRDTQHMAGGSSGGSAAAVASGLVPIALGSDTNGSVRVPAAFCGVYGLKPTFGRLSRQGMFPFAHSLDHVGCFARTVQDLACVYDAMQGHDATDPAQIKRPVESTLAHLRRHVSGLRVGVLDGWFRACATPESLAAVDKIAAALGTKTRVALPHAEIARAAAFCITAAEGASLHLSNLRKRAADFDPATRDRLLVGALLPASVVLQAHRFRQWFITQVMGVFEKFDALIAPCTPSAAPLLGQTTMRLGHSEVAVRPNIGIYTQPLSFAGLPVAVVPIQQPGKLPLGVQIIAAPWHERTVLQIAATLEADGIGGAPIARDKVHTCTEELTA